MELVSVIGLVASTLSGVGFLPQVVKTWRSKEAIDISGPMLVIWIGAALAWETYGLIQRDVYILGCNLAILILALVLFVFKLSFKGAQHQEAARAV